MMTEPQIRDRSKTVTRRLGWRFLKPGQEINAVRKAMGLKKGEKVEVLARLRVVDVMREPLVRISKHDVIKEGFPGLRPSQFVTMFMEHMKCGPEAIVNRIEFEYLDD